MVVQFKCEVCRNLQPLDCPACGLVEPHRELDGCKRTSDHIEGDEDKFIVDNLNRWADRRFPDRLNKA